MSDYVIEFLADKVHAHRWPQDSPMWSESIKKQLDESINKNPEKKQVTVKNDIVQINDFEFSSIKKVGVSVPFFKNECTMIFEGKLDEIFAHVHVTTKNGDFLDVFNRLISWRRQFLQDP